MPEYEVLRQHYGDKQYWPGDTREANKTDVQHLLDGGTLAQVKAKSEPKPTNKAEPAVSNKADALDHDSNGRKGGVKKAEG